MSLNRPRVGKLAATGAQGIGRITILIKLIGAIEFASQIDKFSVPQILHISIEMVSLKERADWYAIYLLVSNRSFGYILWKCCSMLVRAT